MRRRWLFVSLALGLAGALVVWLATMWIGSWRFEREMLAAKREFAHGQFREAAARLNRLAKRQPSQGELEYLLGACERADGRPDEADEAWSRVPESSPEAASAALARGKLALEQGRYAFAETCFVRAIPAGTDIGDEAERLRGRLDWIVGRSDDYKRTLRRDAKRSRDPADVLRTLWSVDMAYFPIDSARAVLERAHRNFPEDDRVWLGLANLATMTGQWDSANEWLTRCESKRPSDPAVLRSRLEWARMANRPDEAAKAAARLPASTLTRFQMLVFDTWLAARAGDKEAERASLVKRLELDPGDSAAYDRLADLAAQAGDSQRVADLRRRKAASDLARERVRAVMSEKDVRPHALEIAKNSELMGRWFDARAWWAVVGRTDRSPEIDQHIRVNDERLAQHDAVAGPASQSLAELLPGLKLLNRLNAASVVKLRAPRFSEQAKERGIDFVFENGQSAARQLPETMSGGVGVLDYDGDGLLDVYAIQGGVFPPPTGARTFADRLYRNLGGGRFEDATASSGLAAFPGGYGHGVAVGDYDNDGRPDLFITRWGSYALYHNKGGGAFEDATIAAGFGGDRDYPTSAAWADLDGDGDLDLYVCHYLQWDVDNPIPCEDPQRPDHVYCDPRNFRALPDHLFRNDKGRFVDVTKEAGIVDREGRGLGVVAADLDGDGKIDLFVANDTTANYFFRNLGGLRFEEEGLISGLATNASGGYLAGMGVACGDFDGDGLIDLAVTNFFGETTSLYHNLGGGLFSDRAAEYGLAGPTRFVLGFGLAALDANNDGRLDLIQANGHVNDYRPKTPYEMPTQLFLGEAGGRFVEGSNQAGPDLKIPRVGRGLAVADLDNNGRLDVLEVGERVRLALFHNQTPLDNHFVTFALEGTASNKDGVGAKIIVTAGSNKQFAERFGGGSYMSASDRRMHFGLGPATKAHMVEVVWPSGRRDRFENLDVDQGYLLREGDPTAAPLRGFGKATSRP
jgi:enediyne biosynthesis protein E4